MKGQYLAIEGVLTFGMGVVIAIGTVSAFSGYKSDLMGTAVEQQADIVEAKVSDAVYALESAESGHKRVDLPEQIGNSEYQVALDDGVKIFVNNRNYTTDFSGLSSTYEFKGSVSGGSVKVFKSGNQYTLRAD